MCRRTENGGAGNTEVGEHQLTEILAPQGLTLEKAIELFLRETVRLGRIPFEYTDEDIAAAKAMHEKKK